jgi:adenine C2-methylase RlmN of 23S rRNA A2503 and tRNA A37
MPAAMRIEPALAALEFYHKLTGNSVEIHYTLIEGVNDSVDDAYKLGHMLKFRDIPVKILKYNEREAIQDKSSGNVDEFMNTLKWVGVPVEYYNPPGFDVGSSCGALLLYYYLKYD